MKKITTLISLLVCACCTMQAQTNFVKNPDFEKFQTCPNYLNQIVFCNFWSIPVDTISTKEYCAEYYNSCGNSTPDHGDDVPNNSYFYQNPHSGNGLAAAGFFYDKTAPPMLPGIVPVNYRDYLQGRLRERPTAGKKYCVSFWINLAEASGYGHNKIGAYLDNGSINISTDTPGTEILNKKPQVYIDEIISDTANWIKVEGDFMANGDETHITIGVFVPNDSITTILAHGHLTQYSYYLIDDVSVIPIDLDADGGTDSHAEPGKSVPIGRVGDTTALGLDCKWYYKGALIDSGAVINVLGAAIVGAVDTYVVVQTVCGLVKSDTVTVTTVPVGMKEWNANQSFTVYPNPSNGAFTITQTNVIPHAVIPNAAQRNEESIHATLYDLLGRTIHQQNLIFNNNTVSINIDAVKGNYILQLRDGEGNTTHQRIIIE